MLTGYIRRPAGEVALEAHVTALREAGCFWTFTDFDPAPDGSWPELRAALDTMTWGDTLLVVRIDHLAREIAELRSVLFDCHQRGLIVRSIEDGLLSLAPSDQRLPAMISLLAGRTRSASPAIPARGIRRRGRPAKRREMRRDPRMRVNATAILIPAEGVELPSRVRDVSRGGVCITTPRGFRADVGSRLNVSSVVFGGARPVRLVAVSPRRLHLSFDQGIEPVARAS